MMRDSTLQRAWENMPCHADTVNVTVNPGNRAKDTLTARIVWQIRCGNFNTATSMLLHVFDLYVRFPLISGTFVCAVVHATEKGYPVLVIW